MLCHNKLNADIYKDTDKQIADSVSPLELAGGISKEKNPITIRHRNLKTEANGGVENPIE